MKATVQIDFARNEPWLLEECFCDTSAAHCRIHGEDSHLELSVCVGELAEDLRAALHRKQQLQDLAEPWVRAAVCAPLHLVQMTCLVRPIHYHSDHFPSRRHSHKWETCRSGIGHCVLVYCSDCGNGWHSFCITKLSPYWEDNNHTVNKFPAFYGTRSFVTVLTRPRYWFLSWARCIQPTRSHPSSTLIQASYLCQSSAWALRLRFCD